VGKNKLHKAFKKHKPCSTLVLGNNFSRIPFSFQRVQSSPAKTSSQAPCQLPASSPQQPTQPQKQQPTQQQQKQQPLQQQQQPRGLNQSVRKVARCLLTFIPCFHLPAAGVCSSGGKGTCMHSTGRRLPSQQLRSHSSFYHSLELHGVFGFQLECGSRRGAWHSLSLPPPPAKVAAVERPSGMRFQEHQVSVRSSPAGTL